MRRTLVFVLGGMAAAVIAWPGLPPARGHPALAGGRGPCWVGEASLDREESAFLDLINGYRAEHGLAPLTISARLVRSARWMVHDVAKRRDFDHTDSLGRNAGDRAADCGYGGAVGENIAAGTTWSAAADAFGAWRRSAGHDRNMLADYRTIGVARLRVPGSTYEWYWTTDFGVEEDTAPTDAPEAAFRGSTAPPAGSLALRAGANLVTWPGGALPPSAIAALTGAAAVTIIYAYDGETGSWRRYGPGLPDYVNSLRMLEPGTAYWLVSDGEAELAFTE